MLSELARAQGSTRTAAIKVAVRAAHKKIVRETLPESKTWRRRKMPLKK